MNKIWVLTSSYNDYNQHGDYFVAAFKNFPTEKQLAEFGIIHPVEVAHVLSGGGREKYEDQWYTLEEYKLL